MKIAVIADTHIPCGRGCREDPRLFLVTETIRVAVHAAFDHGIAAMIVAGDVFDAPYPTPYALRVAKDAFSLSGPVVLAAGNHDVASAEEHALLAYPYGSTSHNVGSTFGLHQIAEGWILPDRVDVVPYTPHSCSGRDWLAKQSLRPRVPGFPRLLVSHLGIASYDSPAYLSGRDVITYDELHALQQSCDYSVAMMGNWHGERDFLDDPEHRAYQVGALCPTGFDNPGPQGSYGRILVWDSVTNEVEALRVRHPTYRTLSGEEGIAALSECLLLASDMQDRRAQEVDHIRVRVSTEEERAAVEGLAESVSRACGRYVVATHVWAREVAEERRDRAEAAADVVRSATALTLEQRIDRYVRARPLPPGIDHEQVIQIACAHARGRTE